MAFQGKGDLSIGFVCPYCKYQNSASVSVHDMDEFGNYLIFYLTCDSCKNEVEIRCD